MAEESFAPGESASAGQPSEVHDRRTLFLSNLSRGLGRISPGFGRYMAEAASVCLADQGHGRLVEFRLDGFFDERIAAHRLNVHLAMKASHNDDEVATEFGAYGISLLALLEMTGLVVVARAKRGRGFDFWLASPKDLENRRDDALPFQGLVRLEVSGIRSGSPSDVAARARQKATRVADPEAPLGALVAIVEFSTPLLKVVEP